MAKITFVARMTVKPDKRAEFIGLCRQLEEYVRLTAEDRPAAGCHNAVIVCLPWIEMSNEAPFAARYARPPLLAPPDLVILLEQLVI